MKKAAEIDKMNKLELVTYMLSVNPFKPIFTKRFTTKELREQAKNMKKPK